MEDDENALFRRAIIASYMILDKDGRKELYNSYSDTIEEIKEEKEEFIEDNKEHAEILQSMDNYLSNQFMFEKLLETFDDIEDGVFTD